MCSAAGMISGIHQIGCNTLDNQGVGEGDVGCCGLARTSRRVSCLYLGRRSCCRLWRGLPAAAGALVAPGFEEGRGIEDGPGCWW